MKKIIILITIFSTTLIFGFSKEIKAQEQPNESLFNVKVLQHEPQTSDTHTIIFDTKVGIVDNPSLFDTNMLLYFDTNVVYFVPQLKGNYLLLDNNYNLFKTIYDFDYLEINEVSIIFYKNDIIVYGTAIANVYNIIWEWDGITVPDYNDGYRDATEVFNERLEQLKNEYEDRIALIIDYYRSQGYDEGLGENVSESEAYRLGYKAGSNDSFLAGLQNWIVPAIIVVIILGGFVTIIQKRKDGET